MRKAPETPQLAPTILPFLAQDVCAVKKPARLNTLSFRVCYL